MGIPGPIALNPVSNFLPFVATGFMLRVWV